MAEPLKIDAGTSAVAYHIQDGRHEFPYAIDARMAISQHPKEWSWTPWGKDGEKTVPVADIPDDWQDMSALARINLAVQLGATRKGLTAAKADEVIQAEVDKRAEAQPEA